MLPYRMENIKNNVQSHYYSFRNSKYIIILVKKNIQSLNSKIPNVLYTMPDVKV